MAEPLNPYEAPVEVPADRGNPRSRIGVVLGLVCIFPGLLSVATFAAGIAAMHQSGVKPERLLTEAGGSLMLAIQVGLAVCAFLFFFAARECFWSRWRSACSGFCTGLILFGGLFWYLGTIPK